MSVMGSVRLGPSEQGLHQSLQRPAGQSFFRFQVLIPKLKNRTCEILISWDLSLASRAISRSQ